MADEWKTLSLDQLYEFGSGLSKPRSAFGSGYPFLSFKDIFYNSCVPANLGELVNSMERERSHCAVLRGDVFLTRTSETMDELGMSCVALRDVPNATFNGFTKRLRPRTPNAVVPEYARYYFRAPAFRQSVTAMSSLSTRASLNNEMLSRLSITFPPLEHQAAIGHILGTLDDKIELNRRMSETLETMARALFKSWFVDFDPVRAKMEGRDPGLPQPFADLLPARLVDSELGEIPEGWGVARLGDVLAELVSGARPKGGAAVEGVPSIGAENVIGLGKYDFSKEKYVPREFFEALQRRGSAVRPGDVLLYKDGAQIGRKSYFDCGFPHPECAVNEHVFIVRGKQPCQQRYLFFWLDQDWMTQEIISLNSNSAQPGINQQGVRGLPFLMPPDHVVDAFERFSKPLTNRLFAGCLKSRTLAALRNALLPQLISGELRVKDAQRFLEGVRA